MKFHIDLTNPKHRIAHKTVASLAEAKEWLDQNGGYSEISQRGRSWTILRFMPGKGNGVREIGTITTSAPTPLPAK